MYLKAVIITIGLIQALSYPLALADEPSSSSPIQVGAAAIPLTPVDDESRLWQEPFTDANGNGRYDAPNPRRPKKPFDPFTDLNQNGKWDGPFLAGFKHKGDYYVATGVHDPLWARALVFSLQDKKIALVSLDLVGLFYSEVQRIRDNVSDLGFDYVGITSTHTHSGPDTLGLWGPNPLTDGKDPHFMEYIRRQTVLAIRRAARTVSPARLTLVETTIPRDFGSVIQDRRDPIVIDHHLSALMATSLSGETIAIAVNGAAHPETLGGKHALISSDFPHYVREALEKGNYTVHGERISGWGGVAIYFSGAVGGLMTTLGSEIQDESGQVLPQRSFEKTQRIGELSAWAVTRALKQSKPIEVSKIHVDSRRLYLPVDNRYLRTMLEKGVLDRITYTNGKPAKTKGEDILTEVGLITFLGKQKPVAQFVAIPGELFPELVYGGLLTEAEKCWKVTERKKAMDGVGRERIGTSNPHISPESPLGNYLKSPIQFVLGLANDELGYIVPANDFVFPRYTPKMKYGIDRCGDDDHYEETLSVSSKMAPMITKAIIEMLEQSDDTR